ncbi:MAG TPA: efflux transporter outer membrane subunit [Rhodospirillaceae bacterium]|nr:efflux transporter outer membrane subunit [Rhodospirillaceae bacterium]
MLKLGLWSILSLLALTGCSVGPDFHPPEPALPSLWQSAAESGDGPTANWWQGFGMADLSELMQRAQQANPDLGAAVARVRQADAQAKIAGAALLPSLQANAGPSRSRGLATIPKSGNRPEGLNSFGLSVTMSYELDFWGRAADLQDIALSMALASRFDQQTAALGVEAGVVNAYFSLLALRQRVEIATKAVANAEAVLVALRARSGEGLATEQEITQQEALLADQRALLLPLQQQQREWRNSLAILTGQQPEGMAEPGGHLAEILFPAVKSGLPAALLAHRPDIQAAQAQLQAANADIKAAWAATLPDVVVTAQGGLQSHRLGALLDPASVAYSLAASITQPLFSGGILEGGLELKQARYDELLELYRKAVLAALVDVENALAAVSLGQEQETARQNAATSARHSLQAAQAQLQMGLVDRLAVLTAERNLYQTEDLLAQARLNHGQALVGLFRALGGGWQAEAQ